MELMYIAVPIGLFVGAAFVAAFLWATRNGQFDDLDAPAYRAIHPEHPVAPLLTPSRTETQSVRECLDANFDARGTCALPARAPRDADVTSKSAW